MRSASASSPWTGGGGPRRPARAVRPVIRNYGNIPQANAHSRRNEFRPRRLGLVGDRAHHDGNARHHRFAPLPFRDLSNTLTTIESQVDVCVYFVTTAAESDIFNAQSQLEALPQVAR